MSRCLGVDDPDITEKMDEAKAFVNYMTAPEQAVTLAQARSNFITPRFGSRGHGRQPLHPTAGDVLRNRRSHEPAFPYTGHQAQAVVDTVFNGYLAGQFDIDEAIANGQRDIEALGE